MPQAMENPTQTGPTLEKMLAAGTGAHAWAQCCALSLSATLRKGHGAHRHPTLRLVTRGRVSLWGPPGRGVLAHP